MKLHLLCSILLPAALLAQNQEHLIVRPAGATVPTPVVSSTANVPPDTVVLTIGDMKLTREQFEMLIRKDMASKISEEERRKMARGLADIVVLAAEARRQALDQTPAAKLNLDIVADQWLAQAVINKEIADKPIDESVLKDYYEKHKEQYDQVTARHILVRVNTARGVPLRPGQKDLTDAEALAKAEELKKKLEAGADFATLAKTESDEPGADKSGGQLPPFKHGQMVPEFEKAAFAAEVGKVVGPVKTIFGYHLILVTDHKAQPFDQVKVDIEQKMKIQMEQQYLDEMRKKTPVTIDQAYFGKPAPAPPTLGAAPAAQAATKR